MFHKHSKKGKRQAKPLKELIGILPVKEILIEDKRALLLQQIRTTCALEKTRFDSLCLSIIDNLINHVQMLPESSNSYYSQPGGLLDYALNRTESALNLFKQFILLEDKADYSEEQKLWQYVLISAALLQGIGKLQIDYQVELYDNHGQYLKLWNPLLENLTSIGSYYNYHFQKKEDIDLRHRLTILMAHAIMPPSGFTWIASDAQVLAVWLALLNEDYHAAGTLGAILIRADALALQRYLNQLSLKIFNTKHYHHGRASTFAEFTPDSINEIEQQLGIQFIQWLNKSLESGLIMINKAPLFMVPGGLLMSPDIFKWFVREHPEYKNWQAVKNGFLSLKLHQVGPDGSVINRFEQTNTQKMHSGIVFTNYAIALPGILQLYNLKTEKSEAITDLEFINLAQFSNQFTSQHQTNATEPLKILTAAGEWQVKTSTPALSPTLKPRTIPNG